MTGFYRWFWELIPANPILLRVVQGGSRRTRHLWVRMGYLGFLILLVTIGLVSGGGLIQSNLAELAKAGSWVFAIVSTGQVLLICLLAPLFMAGAIAQEQSGQTYDILLTTPMSNLQIVLGSLCGRLFFVLTLLASGLPLFAVLLVFGGVPIASVFAAFGIAATVAVTTGSVAIALAVSRLGGQKAVYIFVVAVVAYLIACYAADQVLRNVTSAGLGAGAKPTTVLTPLHPVLVLESFINSANYRTPSQQEVADLPWAVRFYLGRPLAAFITLGLAGSAILASWSALRLRAIGYNAGRSTVVSRLRSKLGVGLVGEGGERRRAPRTVSHNPIAWREAHTRVNRTLALVGRLGFVLLAVVAAGWLILSYHFAMALPIVNHALSAQDLHTGLMMLVGVELAVIVLVAIYLSAGSVSREREDGTLDLLLTTPITPRQYIWGKLRGLVGFLTLLMAAPVVTMMGYGAYVMIAESSRWPQARATFTVPQGGSVANVNMVISPPEVGLLLPLVIVPFVALSVATGMWWSLKAKGVVGAVVPTVAVLGLLSLVLGVCGSAAAWSIPFVGPFLNAASPITAMAMYINPWETVSGMCDNPELGRAILAASAILSAAGYALIVYSMVGGMVRSFDHTVRKLSGGTN